jgi:hypothetical protein
MSKFDHFTTNLTILDFQQLLVTLDTIHGSDIAENDVNIPYTHNVIGHDQMTDHLGINY